ncbi:very short patch repair endonuclease [Methylobacterium sp. Leaf117]|uniref:very short patch repair endonuclease n=1 Tax=Methylobacterium sp. Leaf117 TaxID=1736260 RepID=UPI0009E9496A|nr:very short patch repair endonuclease [Methylobacterium sp. Leaf117]
MADRLTPEQRRLNMSRVRAKDTGPEMAVRRLLHHAGYRYRLHSRELPGRPDLVLPRYRTVVFVHGCFWHGHGCSLFKVPTTRTEFWTAKIDANKRRDEAAVVALATAGWRSLWVWECALRGRGRRSPEALRDGIVAFINGETGFQAIGQAEVPSR